MVRNALEKIKQVVWPGIREHGRRARWAGGATGQRPGSRTSLSGLRNTVAHGAGSSEAADTPNPLCPRELLAAQNHPPYDLPETHRCHRDG